MSDGSIVAAAWFAIALLSTLSAGCSPAHAGAQYRLLDPAIAVRNPDQVLLEAVTRAGNRLVAVGEYGVVIYSDDNARSWHQASVPVDPTLTTVAFATPQDGWAGGAMGVVLHTTDGGQTWKMQTTGDEIDKLILATANGFATAQPNDPRVSRALRRAGIFMQAGPDKPLLSILALDANNVQIFGAYRICLKSEDAGANWQDCSLDVPDPISHNLYDAVQAGAAIYVAGESGSVFRSNDQGVTFSALTAPADSTLFGILATPSNSLLTFGVAGGLFRSTDQGQSWLPQTIGSQSDLTAGTVLNSGKIVILSETGNVYLSADDGASFQALPGNEGMGLFGLAQARNGDLVLVGTGGVRVVPSASLR